MQNRKLILKIIQMSWYGNYNESTRKLDDLIETKPPLSSLIVYPDFIQHLKSFNPKLLDYMTNSPTLPQQIITYISIPPIQSDSIDRKYKLPLLTVEMVESETMCIMNALLKQNPQGQKYFLSMFNMLKQSEILPLLAGYFSRVNQSMCRTKYQEVLESVYSSSYYLQLLIQHSEMDIISNLLPLYLCIEISKNIVFTDQKTLIKIGIVKTILNKIQTEKTKSDYRSKQIVSNLCLVIRDIIQKYYLIANGKQMIELILQEKYAVLVLNMIAEQSENSFPAMSLALSFLKYYSLSAFNAQEANEELTKKNMERLQCQPFIKVICSQFNGLLTKVKRQKVISLYGFTLLEVLCHCITLSSIKILSVIKQSELFPILIELLFKNESCNILHKLVQRTILHVFITQKNIYEKYKQYLFCQTSIIDLTVRRLLDLFPQIDCFKKVKNKAYFGILMKIITIYSKVSPNNKQIWQAIQAKTEIWNTMKNKIIIPYETICKEQVGHLQNIADKPPLQYTVRKTINELMPCLIQNVQVIEQIKRQEQTMPKTLQLSDVKKQSQTLLQITQTKIEDDSFFKSPLEDTSNKKNNDVDDIPVVSNPAPTIQESQNKQSTKKLSTSFTQFLNKKKVQVGQEIKIQRSLSSEKRLSADRKTRLTSPSPSRKKNSWKDDESVQQQSKKEDRRIALTKDLPKIPVSHKTQIQGNHPLAKSSVEQPKKSQEDENKRIMSLSMANMQSLRKTTVIRRNDIPSQKKFRTVQEKDLALFAYLGLRY